jgi:hypothetical protein
MMSTELPAENGEIRRTVFCGQSWTAEAGVCAFKFKLKLSRIAAAQTIGAQGLSVIERLLGGVFMGGCF